MPIKCEIPAETGFRSSAKTTNGPHVHNYLQLTKLLFELGAAASRSHQESGDHYNGYVIIIMNLEP